jgi:general secretion pathway protein H
MTSSSPERRRRGVTLLELILVMVMISLLAGLLVPRMTGFFPAFRLRKSTDLVFRWARKAHAEAALTGSRHRVVFDVAGRRILVEYEARPLTEPGVFGPVPGWEDHELPEGIFLEGVEAFEFRSDGTAEGGAVTLFLEEGETRTVEVQDATGRVTILEETEEPTP